MTSPSSLSDRDLLAEVERAVTFERHATARLISLLMEVDSRKLYAGQGCSSLFTYCVQHLHLSEHAAYLRIESARVARRFPVILGMLTNGSLHLTAVSLLGPHLTAANHVELLESAIHKTKREVEQFVARLRPQPEAPASVRKLPAPASVPVQRSEFRVPPSDPTLPVVAQLTLSAIAMPVAPRPPEIKSLAPERYKLQCTVSGETYDKLRRAQDLLRHTVPSDDLAAILDRALTLLLVELSRTKFAATDRPRCSTTGSSSRSRHIPAAVKREVWTRDGGCCAFQGELGRCTETGFLEFHHVVPYVDQGETSTGNLQLRCRAHNQYEMDLWCGQAQPVAAREWAAIFGK